MKKADLLNLVKGNKIQHKRNGQILTVEAVLGEGIQCEEKFITTANATRWFDIVEEPVQPATSEPQEEEVQNDNQVNQPQSNEPGDVVRGNTAKTEGQQIFESSISGVIIQHGCYIERKKEYIKISKEGYKGTICMIRNTRKGNIHIDMKSKIFAALTEQYRDMLIEKYDAKIYDKSRGYFRISECDDLDVLEVVITKALLLNGEVLAV